MCFWERKESYFAIIHSMEACDKEKLKAIRYNYVDCIEDAELYAYSQYLNLQEKNESMLSFD